MGDIQVCSVEPSSLFSVNRSSSSSSPLASSIEARITAGCWQKAEATVRTIIDKVHPTNGSEETRRAIVDYVKQLIRDSTGCEAFLFGSVPLKTYLCDGDIDLTAFGSMNAEETLATDVFSALTKENQNGTAEFLVKDVQLIRAEVKLVKCLIQNMVVDISFNQIGGICTLCFLELVDRVIGNDHLFKRSIILIKAWCFYESRILGSHQGLISTYALETMVLYIFHVFHSSLNGPLAVLHKFLDYFSKFDWENYGISLKGPVRISSLPEIVVETPENGGYGLLFTDDFLKYCAEKFMVPVMGFKNNSQAFSPKHLNIVDPLKENNNLGRSVNKGNFYRIRSALTCGAQKLQLILSQPEENIADELSNFFGSTLNRHASGHRPDVQDQTILESEFTGPVATSGEGGLDHEHLLHGRDNVKASGREMRFHGIVEPPQNSARGTHISENCLSGDVNDPTFRIQSLSISNDAIESSDSNVEDNASPESKLLYAPHLYFSQSAVRNGEAQNENPERKQPESAGSMKKRGPLGVLPAPDQEAARVIRGDLIGNQVTTNHGLEFPVVLMNRPVLFSSAVWSSEVLHPQHSSNQVSVGAAEVARILNSLTDLSGDFESHLHSLQQGRWCSGYGLNPPIPSMSPPPTSLFQSQNSLVVKCQPEQFRKNVISPVKVNGVARRLVFNSTSQSFLSGRALHMEETPKQRGTGTYFPNVNRYEERALNNGHIHQVGKKSKSSDFRLYGSRETKPFGVPLPESGQQSNPVLAEPQYLRSGTPRLKPVSGIDQRRIADPSYRMKDDDFPPLSNCRGKGLSHCMVRRPDKQKSKC